MTGTREGKRVLAVLRYERDSETGERFTVERYESRKTPTDGPWSHGEITLSPDNPDCPPIAISSNEGDRIAVVAELVEVLRPGSAPSGL